MSGPVDRPREAAEAAAVEPVWYLLHDSSLQAEELQTLTAQCELQPVVYAEREGLAPQSRVLLRLGDEQIRDVAPLAVAGQWQVGLLEHPDAPRALAALGVRGRAPELVRHYRNCPVVEADALTCNGELIFSSVVIGRVLSLRPRDINQPQTRRSMLQGALRGLGRLRLQEYRLTTAKGRTVRLAALGLVALGYTESDLVLRSFRERPRLDSGRVTLLALAPRSVMSYLLLLLRLVLPGKLSLARLPPAVALVQSSSLLLEAPLGVEYLLDGKPVHTTRIQLGLMEGRLQLLPGPALRGGRSEPERATGDRETLRLGNIPQEDGATALLSKSLPLFRHAGEDEYRELFVGLRESATATAPYQVLMVLSVLLALTGLYADSAPVIIGAMILAPLMSPVVSLGMGLARADPGLIRPSLRTLGIGVLWGLGCAVLAALAMPLEIPTAEMRARMSPTLLDLMVAVIAGVAGAYASSREEIARSLAGVAIAVALVPPLAVAGIGLGWGEPDMAGGAMLLFVTNLVGISLAGSCTFLVLGFAPFNRARAGLAVAALVLLVISAPLYVAFRHLVERDDVLEHIPTGHIELAGTPVHVSEVRVTLDSPHLVRVVMSSPRRLDHQHVEALKQLIETRIGEPVLLEALLTIRR